MIYVADHYDIELISELTVHLQYKEFFAVKITHEIK